MITPRTPDDHRWRELTSEEEKQNWAPDPHSSRIICDVCHLNICMFCGVEDPGYTNCVKTIRAEP